MFILSKDFDVSVLNQLVKHNINDKCIQMSILRYALFYQDDMYSKYL